MRLLEMANFQNLQSGNKYAFLSCLHVRGPQNGRDRKPRAPSPPLPSHPFDVSLLPHPTPSSEKDLYHFCVLILEAHLRLQIRVRCLGKTRGIESKPNKIQHFLKLLTGEAVDKPGCWRGRVYEV